MNSKFLRLIISALLFLSSSLYTNDIYAEKGPYSIQDLEILNQQKSFQEFLTHAKDIRPSKRNKYWNEMVMSMGIGHLQQQARSKSFEKKDFLFNLKVSSWSILAKDEFFQVKLNQYALAYLKQCLISAKAQDCLKDGHHFWRLSNKDPETGYQLAKMIRGFFPNHDLFSIFAPIAQHSASSFYCHRPIVANTITSQFQELFNSSTNKLTNNQISQRIDILLHPECWKALRPILVKGLFEQEAISKRVTIYKVLYAKNAITQTQKDLFYTLYLLNRPSVGAIFNHAWNNLKSLGQNYQRRQKVLKALKKRDPLEGAIFSLANKTNKTAVIKLFSENFPEYLDHYAKTCLRYREGKQIFPRGNPTLECNDLFSLTQGKPYVEQTLQWRYSGLRKN